MSYQAIVKTPQPVILKFYTETCYDCQQIAPKLDRVVHNNPPIQLVAINLQNASLEEKQLAKDLGVVTVPNVLYVTESGKIVRQFLDNTDETELDGAAKALKKANLDQDPPQDKP